MGKVVADISQSLDGFATGPDDGPGNALGTGGEPIHDWVHGGPWTYAAPPFAAAPGSEDARQLETAAGGYGASVLGRRLFDITGGWGEEPPFHAPAFVLTSRPQEPDVRKGGTTFHFVTDGIESAVRQAREAAGERDVALGSPSAIQQAFAAGLVDEVRLHVANVVMGAGRPLWAGLGELPVHLEKIAVVDTPTATHVHYRVAGRGPR